MIQKIKIKNFKALTSFELECLPLNLLTGTNGSGKSTTLQSLLLLRQSHRGGFFNIKGSPIFLGNYEALISLGTFKDVISAHAIKGEEFIDISISSENRIINVRSSEYTSDNKDKNFINSEIKPSVSALSELSLFSDSFQYLSAERISPREDYPRFQSEETFLGKDGAFTAHYLETFGNIDIPISELALTELTKSLALIDQVNAWMALLSNNIEVLTKENLNTNRIELSFRYKSPAGVPSQDYKPMNVGFGITHTLPIVVALLAAKPGDLLIIENPETHLHPKSQSNLAQLFSMAAANGVQLFVETHSDHIINGTRVAIKKQIIDSTSVGITYFSRNDNNVSAWERILVDEEGGLSNWPRGFFDEWDNLLSDLL